MKKQGEKKVKTRGYFGIGIYNGKTPVNLGTLWRSAFQMGASFIFTIGKRYKKQASDTYKSWRHLPLWQFDTWEDFTKSPLYDCKRVGIEFCEKSICITEYKHPQRAVYILGAEDGGLPSKIVNDCHDCVELPSVRQQSYNVAVAGSIVMFDRVFVHKTT